jgi:hypothetical protein
LYSSKYLIFTATTKKDVDAACIIELSMENYRACIIVETLVNNRSENTSNTSNLLKSTGSV